jgi:hypothetical protein
VVTIDVENGCRDGKTLLLSAVDATGAVTNHTAVDFLSFTGDFGMNITVWMQASPSDITTVNYSPAGALSYKVGSAPNREHFNS